MNMRARYAAILALAVSCAALAPSASAEEITYNSWLSAAEYANSRGIVPFWNRVKARTNGAVTAKMFYAGQMMGQRETLQGVVEGAVDSGIIIPSLTPNKTPALGILNEVQAYSPDAVVALAAALETQFLNCEACGEEAKKNGIVVLGGHVNPPYYLMCTRKLADVNELKGMRVRALVRYQQHTAQKLGMTPVNVSFPEQVPALQNGQIDCLVTGASWLDTLKLNELMKSVVTSRSLGAYPAPSTLTFNRKVWQGLAKKTQEAIVAEAPRSFVDVTIAYVEQEKTALANAKAAGVALTDLGAAYDRRIDALKNDEREQIIKTYEGFGVKQTGQILDAYIANYKKWDERLSKVNRTDADTITRLIVENIYNKTKF